MGIPTTSTLTKIPKLPLLLLLLFFTLSLLCLPYLLSFSLSSSPALPRARTAAAELRIRRAYPSYEAYLKHQLNKTLNPDLRRVWTTRDWDRKVAVFSRFFSDLVSAGLLSNTSRCLCVGARVGQEVAALRGVGVSDAVGMDLVPYPPLVVRGDFHAQPFGDGAFDFEFSNVFDHALYPDRFVGEIQRTLRVGGICALHVSLNKRADKYSANDLFSVKPLLGLFNRSRLVRVRSIDGFGLDTEVVFRKFK